MLQCLKIVTECIHLISSSLFDPVQPQIERIIKRFSLNILAYREQNPAFFLITVENRAQHQTAFIILNAYFRS